MTSLIVYNYPQFRWHDEDALVMEMDCKAAKSVRKAARFRTFYQLCVNLKTAQDYALDGYAEGYLMKSDN